MDIIKRKKIDDSKNIINKLRRQSQNGRRHSLQIIHLIRDLYLEEKKRKLLQLKTKTNKKPSSKVTKESEWAVLQNSKGGIKMANKHKKKNAQQY